MIKQFIVSLTLIFTVAAMGQTASSSPYSFYGIGDLVFKGTVETRSMGGINMLKDSIHVNVQNAAGLSDLMYTTYTIGGNLNKTSLQTTSDNESAQRISLDYLLIGMPITKKFGVAVGLMPYTSVGYQIRNISDDESEPSYRYTGTGGINRVYAGLGYKLNKSFSVGADFNYNFGEISTSNISFLSDIQYGTREKNVSNISGANVNLAMMYNRKLNEKLTFFGSAVYSPEGTLTLQNERNIATVQFSETFGETVIESEDIPVEDTKIKIPSKFTFGLGIGQMQKWSVGAELSIIQASKTSNRFTDIRQVSFENSTKLNIGGYYLPNFKSFTSYFSRVNYRAGFFYQNTGMVINNESITNFGITFGLGLPLGGSFSNMNIGYEYGKRGTTNAGLIQENYSNITISLSLNDKWFLKRKID
ncbi:membrane protein [Flavobacterium filum]|uniref:membrane protein n=1 Tax=Flavobacterium TaxID=237 RepID=UPI0003FE8ED8|nr:membrane protein [Flavobacterium filum]